MGKKQNSNKQGKKLKKMADADAAAQDIIKAAHARVAERRTPYDAERKEGIEDSAWFLGVQVRQLREEGVAWWAIARDLEMSGAGDSATTGKKGAARARTAYKAAFGDFPRTFKTGGYKGPVEKNEHIAAMKKQKRSELKAQAMSDNPVIEDTLSDEEIAGMLKGRTIKWLITNPEISPEPIEQEAAIHTTWPFYVYIDNNGDRCIEFRERSPRAPVQYRAIPSRIRTVRVKKIFSVK